MSASLACLARYYLYGYEQMPLVSIVPSLAYGFRTYVETYIEFAYSTLLCACPAPCISHIKSYHIWTCPTCAIILFYYIVTVAFLQMSLILLIINGMISGMIQCKSKIDLLKS